MTPIELPGAESTRRTNRLGRKAVLKYHSLPREIRALGQGVTGLAKPTEWYLLLYLITRSRLDLQRHEVDRRDQATDRPTCSPPRLFPE